MAENSGIRLRTYTTPKFGICSVCGIERRLRGDGMVSIHGPRRQPCAGWQQPPRQDGGV